MAINLFNFLEPTVGQQKYYHDSSTFNKDVTICGSSATFGESFILGQSIMCGDVTLAVNVLEKNPKPPNLFVSGDTTLGRNLLVTNSSYLGNTVVMNRNVVINGKLTIAGVADVAAEIQLAKTLPSASDERLKENIHTITDPISKVCSLRGVSYDLKESNKKQIGVIAQEIEKIIPEVVDDIPGGYKGVHYGNLVGLLIEAVKDQQKQIDELKQKLEQLNDL